MGNANTLYVLASSALTPLGPNVTTTHAAVAAGISAYSSSSVLNRNLNPITLASVPDGAFSLPDLSGEKPLYQQRRSERMLGMAASALKALLKDFPLDTPLPLFLAGPESKPCPAIDGYFLTLLARTSGVDIDLPMSRLFATGRPAGIQALELAFRFMHDTGRDYVLVGGVDSLIDLAVMGAWDREERMLAVDSKDGFAPAEGAGFLLLSSRKGADQLPGKALGAVGYPGIAEERGHRYGDAPYTGDGMATAFRSALQAHNGGKIRTVFSSMNGEHFNAKEHGVALIRSSQYMAEAYSTVHPADCYGDMGAAAAPVLMALALTGFKSGGYTAPGIVCCSADYSVRAACTVDLV